MVNDLNVYSFILYMLEDPACARHGSKNVLKEDLTKS